MLRGMERVRIRTPQSLLSLLPRIAGEAEPGSLVVLPLRQGRSGMPMAFDLPGRSEVAAVAAAIRRSAPEADAVVLVACLAEPIGAGPLPGASAERALIAAIDAAGLGVLESLALAPDAWGDYAQPQGARGPRAELDLLDDPAPGVPVPPSVPGLPSPDAEAQARVDAALDLLDDATWEAALDDPLPAFERALALATGLADGGRTGLGVDPADAAALAIALVQRPVDRDLAIVAALDGPAAADLDDEDAAARMLGRGPAPDADRVLEALRAWTAIAGATPLELRAPLLVVVGFLHFALGRGRTAGRCADLAIAADPTLTMAPLLRDLVDARGAPEWVLASRAQAMPSRPSGDTR